MASFLSVRQDRGAASYEPVAAGLAGHLGKVHGLGVQDGVADDARLHALELLVCCTHGGSKRRDET